MWTVWIICGLIVAAVLGLSLLTTHKGYEYKHTVDPLPDDEERERNGEKENQQEKK